MMEREIKEGFQVRKVNEKFRTLGRDYSSSCCSCYCDSVWCDAEYCSAHMIVDLAVFVYFASTLCFLPIYFIVPLFFRKFEVEILEKDER